MIPSDVASRLQVSADTTLRPVAPTQEISDKLSDLVAGQKVMAEIQSLLPNGTYRALINQRNITLALPFSAKSGDVLELQVTETDGKLALAVLSRPDGEGAQSAATTSATLSRTGQFISSLLSSPRDAKGGMNALPLNGNQPLAGSPSGSAQDLLPMLKQAITQSGMFYESHQAEWVEGRLAKAELLQEPQGKLSSPDAFAAAREDLATPTAKVTVDSAGPTPTRLGGDLAQLGTADAGKTGTAAQSVQNAAQPVAPQTQPIVQQQLDALATQNFSWQGQVWPGQDMRWEIDEDAARNGAQDGDDSASRWATRLHLTLPHLGEVDMQVRLNGNQISLALSAGTEETRALMRAGSFDLRNQLDEAGLTLTTVGVSALADEQRVDGGDGPTGA